MAKDKKFADQTDALHEVSSYLVKNHLRATFEPSEWHEFVNSNTLDNLDERRVVAVIGAGASRSAGLPLASEVIKELIWESSLPTSVIEAELDHLSQNYGLDRNAFETLLQIIETSSAFGEQKLRDNLQRIYRYQYIPILGYEILALMMRYRFLDAIINFNFDELLDQSIKDELDPEEYYHILSDEDYSGKSTFWNILTRLPLPYYIKPHGTASQKDTLRFTQDDYLNLPINIQRILRRLLTDEPVVLLVIGFGMQSLEFNCILEDVQPGSKIFHINLVNPTPKNSFKKKFDKNILLKVDGKKITSASEILQSVWEKTIALLKTEYHPHDVKRPILISKTFFRDIKDNNIENYLRGRTIVELCMSIARRKGFVTMSQLANDRSGKYFNLYKELNNDANFYEMCCQVGLKDVGYSREMMCLSKGENVVEYKLSEEEFENQLELLYSRTRNNLDYISRGKLAKDLFCETLLALYQGLEVDVRYRHRNNFTRIFQFPMPITTYSAMKYCTKQILSGGRGRWKYLFVTAETGQWLTDPYFSSPILNNPEARIYLIVADASLKDKLYKKYGEKIVGFQKLQWWEHNRHITILANENQIPFTGIYFSRRFRSTNIIPVFLDSKDDTLSALESFNTYWIKASRQDKDDVDEKENWINASEARNFKRLFELEKITREK